LGALISREGSEVADLTMELYRENNLIDRLAVCILPRLNQSVQEVSCDVDYIGIEQEFYYVCISANQDTSYSINFEFENEVCGTDGGSLIDYEIFAKRLEYSPVEFKVDSQLKTDIYNTFAGITIEDEIFDYILSTYDQNCNPECIIPISFSGVNQLISLIISHLNMILVIPRRQIINFILYQKNLLPFQPLAWKLKLICQMVSLMYHFQMM